MGLVQSFPVPSSMTTGYTIFDHQGRPIGVWYSSLSAGITVDPAAKAVSIATSTPWLALTLAEFRTGILSSDDELGLQVKGNSLGEGS